jgi:outer membrane receptor protein involved in Fe transport
MLHRSPGHFDWTTMVMSLSSRSCVSVALALSLVVASAIERAEASAQGPDAPVSAISGTVVDASGAPVPNVLVRAETDSGRVAETRTAEDGRFTLADLGAGDATVRAAADGFSASTATLAAGERGRSLRLVLHPSPLSDSVTVTGSRGTVRLDSPAGTTVLNSAALFNSGAGALDDALRNTPGFSLFRRSSSRVANPTTQGVTLRGVSGSGASRTLVLADGVALNDPFGSWVYWNRIPQAAIDRVEVVRGATGDLYGADALGGVVQVLTFGPGRPRLRAVADGGSHDTARGSLFGSLSAGRWSGSAAGEWLATDGVLVVAEEDRGAVDVRADSDYRSAFAALAYTAVSWQARGRAGVYAEDRGNGTPLQVNETEWRQVSGEVSGSTATGAWRAHALGGSQSYYQTFTAVAADRDSERLTNVQDVPTEFWSAGGQWTQAWGSHVLLFGAEGHGTESTINETRYSFFGVPSGPFVFGGTERGGSVFGRASLAVSDTVTVGIGARGDFWRSEPRDPSLGIHSVGFFSPRASLTWRVRGDLSVQGSVYRAHRTPTLNELYRGFRVGNIVTNANPALEPERLTGVEGGVLFTRGPTSTRVTAFYNLLDDAIANITQLVTPALITRQRQNADQVRAAGVEIETDLRLTPNLTANALAVFTSSIFRSTPQQPAIEGNRIPQVPEYQLGGGLTYQAPYAFTLAGVLRVVGAQFDDDQNELELQEFAVLDVQASRPITERVHAYVAVENLFDAEYDTGRTPVRTTGWPRTVRGGVRLFLP